MKRRLWLLFSVAVAGCPLHAQNMVTNPSFEGYTSCPIGQSVLFYAIGWQSAGYTPDYMNTCSSFPFTDIPTNYYGTQMPASGNAYAGELFYGDFNSSLPNIREYAYTTLLAPLMVGSTYYVSFNVSLADNARIACNRQGVKFCSSYVSSNPPNNVADVYTMAVISDKVNWTTVSGSFVATAPHTALMIGNWFTDANTTTVNVGSSTNIGNNGYYYLDDVYVGLTPPVLPVEWVHAGVTTVDNVAEISWEMETIAIASFLVERSEDGLAYEEVRELAAHPTQRRYSILDTMQGYEPSTFYRVRAVSHAGGTHLSAVMEAERYPSSINQLSIFPSPVSQGMPLTIAYQSVSSQAVEWQIASLQGRVVVEGAFPRATLGAHEVQVGTHHLAPGAYLLKAGTLTRKFLVRE